MIITAFYAGLLGLLLIVLSLRVAFARLGRRIPLGSGEDRDLERRMRAHGNFSEYAAFALLQLALLETLGTAPLLLHLNGAVFTVGRVLHAWGLSRRSGASPGRMAGIVLSWVAILIMAVMLLGEAVLRLWLR